MGTQRTHREAALARATGRQFGVFTRQQALTAGFTPSTISKRLACGAWTRVDHNVYQLALTPQTWEMRLMAACLAGPAVASHRSAGRLWALPGMEAAPVEVTALRHRRRRSPDVIWHESFHLTPKDITEISGLQLTRPARTVLDLGAVLDPGQLEEVFNEGARRNLVSVPAVWQRMEQLGPLRRGSGRVRRVLETHVPGQRAPESVLETRFLQLIRNAGLPLPVCQHEVRVGDKLIARTDFAYPDLELAIELDGEAFHFGERRDRRDRQRENALVARRWRVLRFDWEDVTRRRDYVIRTVQDAIRTAA